MRVENPFEYPAFEDVNGRMNGVFIWRRKYKLPQRNFSDILLKEVFRSLISDPSESMRCRALPDFIAREAASQPVNAVVPIYLF